MPAPVPPQVNLPQPTPPEAVDGFLPPVEAPSAPGEMAAARPSFDLEATLEGLPREPGVYIMRARGGEIVYVGKAVNLRNRVRQYFRATSDGRAFIPTLRRILGGLDTIVTRTEKEALLLENELVKRHQPRFNVELKDDKRFLCLRVRTDHPWPRIEFVRRKDNDGAQYFGPYTSAGAIRKTMGILNRHFGLRTCRDTEFNRRKRPCLQYQIGRCPAPCVLEVDKDDYGRAVADAKLFLAGRETELVAELKDRMWQQAETGAYERAAKLRDQIFDIERSVERQNAISLDGESRDVFGFARRADRVEVAHVAVRGGVLSSAEVFSLTRQEFPDEEVLGSFLTRYYADREDIPDEVLLPFDVEAAGVLSEWLGDRRGRKVPVFPPQRGDKVRVVEIAQRNAEFTLEQAATRARDDEQMLDDLRRKLKLTRRPTRIECFDISHFQGLFTVASQAVFVEGKPAKQHYRRYRLASFETPDDFASMEEVLRRRLSRGLEQKDLPDLIVIDGGKGQLGAAHTIFLELGITDVDLVSLAKSRTLKEEAKARLKERFRARKPKLTTGALAAQAARDPAQAGEFIDQMAGLDTGEAELTLDEATDGLASMEEHSPERVFVVGRKDPILLRQNSPELFMLARLRDEAHRFAITYHRRLAAGRMTRSALEEVPGVGPKRAKALLKHFGSLRSMQAASLDEIAAVPDVPVAVAEAVFRFIEQTRTGPADEIEGTDDAESDRRIDDQ
jgi:excinuclease ABC subunit C